MNLEIETARKDPMPMIIEKIEKGQTIRRSPHIGNVNGKELTAIAACSELGEHAIQVELVDSVRGNDRYALPSRLLTTNERHSLCSNRQASRVVTKLAMNEQSLEKVEQLGLGVHTSGLDIAALHISSAQAALQGVAIERSSDFMALVDQELLSIGLATAQRALCGSRPLRQVNDEGKIVESEQADCSNIYGVGDNPLAGTLLPLEAILGVEMFLVAAGQIGIDGEYVHIGGPDMISYMRNPDIIGPAKKIAEAMLSAAGEGQGLDVRYIVPCLEGVVASPISREILGQRYLPLRAATSQYDILAGRNSDD